ncbi:hypothetical protein [Nocardioides piscis]|uniref:Uncharacterized protein n=1 Tax=Nocardioides piscis TaxID=2714938 RepID=A0A6G7YFI9_9ACTN|nr:hypothetical protein [Nocardioides piscis]QIK75436.1 hypothetical protein G7071_08290 [Nocardioides piscis]
MEAGTDSWGLLFGSAVVTVVFGSAPLVASLVAATVGGLVTPEQARFFAWCTAVIAATCAAALLLAAGVLVVGPAAEVAFSLVSLLLALVLVAPVVLCVRRARSERP